MRGNMMHRPLLVSQLIEHAARYHGDSGIVSRTVEGPIHRYTWADACRRSRQLSNVLAGLAVQRGDRIATLAWNGYRHLELYFGISGMGAVCHTINPRLFPPQIAWIANHAGDRWLFTDLTFWPLVEKLAPEMRTLEGVVVMTDEAHMPETALANVHCYETLMRTQAPDFQWPELGENEAAALCYTSGTTGDPKGVLYSNRSTVLHAWSVSLPDSLHLAESETLLPVVPMFHVNAWGLPYGAALTGTRLVLPGAGMDGASLHELIESESVTTLAGVPTIWMMLLAHLRETGKELASVRRVVIGGAAAPRAMIETFENDYGVEVRHAWGMTETSPLGTVNLTKPSLAGAPAAQRHDLKRKQGRAVFGVEMKIVDAEGRRLPEDGEAFGELMVRGPWICDGYFRGQQSRAFEDEGWFATGDVATIDADGYMQITDRSKDLIKSGGEWISSIELENLALGHPAVSEAAAIAVAHPRWGERPLLVVVAREGAGVTREELLAHYRGRVADWWIPDDVVFVDELPHTATGKLQKTALRERYSDYVLPDTG